MIFGRESAARAERAAREVRRREIAADLEVARAAGGLAVDARRYVLGRLGRAFPFFTGPIEADTLWVVLECHGDDPERFFRDVEAELGVELPERETARLEDGDVEAFVRLVERALARRRGRATTPGGPSS